MSRQESRRRLAPLLAVTMHDLECFAGLPLAAIGLERFVTTAPPRGATDPVHLEMPFDVAHHPVRSIPPPLPSSLALHRLVGSGHLGKKKHDQLAPRAAIVMPSATTLTPRALLRDEACVVLEKNLRIALEAPNSLWLYTQSTMPHAHRPSFPLSVSPPPPGGTHGGCSSDGRTPTHRPAEPRGHP